NDLIVTLLNEGGARFCTPFVGEPKFTGLNGAADQEGATLNDRYELMMEATSRTFELLGYRARSEGIRCLYLLQPLAAWCKRTFCPEEQELINIWDAHPSVLHRVHFSES